MNRLLGYLGDALSLYHKYGIPTGGLQDTLEGFRSFQVTVPVIGSYNTGKSTMLNALLGRKLLPTGIVAKTFVPTELVWGDENVAYARHGDHTRRLGLGDLRSRTTDFSGVKTIRVECGSPFLRQISRVKLVDMPGLDCVDREQERAMRSYLPQSLAYILVFSADEPVIKESVALFLSELRLREIPVIAVLTKSDKITPEELSRAQKFLKKSLLDMFLLDDIELCTISAREDVEPVRRRLVELHERADELAESGLADHLRQAGLTLASYLTLRMEAVRLAASEMDGRVRLVHSREEMVRGKLGARIELFRRQAEECRKEIGARIRETVEAAAEPIGTMLITDSDPGEYTDGMLRTALASGLISRYRPIHKSCVKSLVNLLNIHGFSDHTGLSAAAGSLRMLLEGPGETGAKALPPTLREALDAMESSRELFRVALDGRSRGWQKRKQELEELVRFSIVPGLVETAEHCLDEALRKSWAQLSEAVEEAVSTEARLAEQAAADIRRERSQEGEGEKIPFHDLEIDLAIANNILQACPGAIVEGR